MKRSTGRCGLSTPAPFSRQTVNSRTVNSERHIEKEVGNGNFLLQQKPKNNGACPQRLYHCLPKVRRQMQPIGYEIGLLKLKLKLRWTRLHHCNSPCNHLVLAYTGLKRESDNKQNKVRTSSNDCSGVVRSESHATANASMLTH